MLDLRKQVNLRATLFISYALNILKYSDETMAILSNCGSISESKTSVMIRRACSEWSGFSALEIAARTPNVTFFEHVQVRKVEQILWYGRVDERNSNWCLLHLARLPFVGFLFFIPCYWFGFIQFHNNRAFRTNKENDEWYKAKLYLIIQSKIRN